MILTYVGMYLMSYLLASFHFYALSGAVLIALALLLYIYEYRKSGRLVNITGLYSLSLVGGQGISCFKLSYLQTDWEPMTWICFFLAYIAFSAGGCLTSKLPEQPELKAGCRLGRHVSYERLLICNCALAGVSLAAFLLEAAVLGYVPLFVQGVPHAYSEFHISGVHYFTVSCVLCPALSIVCFMRNGCHSTLRICAAAAAALSGFVIPLLCVSRYQFAFALMLAVFVWVVMTENRAKIKTVTLIRLACGCLILLIVVYFVLTKARSHDADYLKGIFEMKKDYPLIFSHFYIYIANNFDNFDCMVKNLTKHTFGQRMLYPVWALTGLKFIFPELVMYEYFVTKTELGTLTLFYDAYYDFGVVGVVVFALLLGLCGAYIEQRAFSDKDAGAVIMLYGQFAIYMALSFFTTWFSNPTTWFYFAVTAAIYVLSRQKDPTTGVTNDSKD